MSAVRSGTTWMGLAMFFSLTLTFYTQQWEEYHAHVLRTFIGWFGVTEGRWYSFYQLESSRYRVHSEYHVNDRRYQRRVPLLEARRDSELPTPARYHRRGYYAPSYRSICSLQVSNFELTIFSALTYAYQNLIYAL